MKSEPHVFSITNLKDMPDSITPWNGNVIDNYFILRHCDILHIMTLTLVHAIIDIYF